MTYSKFKVGSNVIVIYNGKLRRGYLIGYQSFIERIMSISGFPRFRGVFNIIIELIQKAWKSDWTIDPVRFIDLKMLSVLLVKNLTNISLKDITSFFSISALVAMEGENGKIIVDDVVTTRVFRSKMEARKSEFFDKEDFGFDLSKVDQVSSTILEAIDNLFKIDATKMMIKGFVRNTDKVFVITKLTSPELTQEEIEALNGEEPPMNENKELFIKLMQNTDWYISDETNDETITYVGGLLGFLEPNETEHADSIIMTRNSFINTTFGLRIITKTSTAIERKRAKKVLSDYLAFLDGNFDPATYPNNNIDAMSENYSLNNKFCDMTYTVNNGTSKQIVINQKFETTGGGVIRLAIDRDNVAETIIATGKSKDKVMKSELFKPSNDMIRTRVYSDYLDQSRMHYLRSNQLFINGELIFDITTANIVKTNGDYKIVSTLYLNSIGITIDYILDLHVIPKPNIGIDEGSFNLKFYSNKASGDEIIDLSSIDYLKTQKLYVLVEPTFTMNATEEISVTGCLHAKTTERTNVYVCNNSNNGYPFGFTFDLSALNYARNSTFVNFKFFLEGNISEGGTTNGSFISNYTDLAINYGFSGQRSLIDLDIILEKSETEYSYEDSSIKGKIIIVPKNNVRLKKIFLAFKGNGDNDIVVVDSNITIQTEDIKLGEKTILDLELKLSNIGIQLQTNIYVMYFIPIYQTATQLTGQVPTTADVSNLITEVGIDRLLNQKDYSMVYNSGIIIESEEMSIYSSNIPGAFDNIIEVNVDKFKLKDTLQMASYKYNLNTKKAIEDYVEKFLDGINTMLGKLTEYDATLEVFTSLGRNKDKSNIYFETFELTFISPKDATGGRKELYEHYHSLLTEAIEDLSFHYDELGIALSSLKGNKYVPLFGTVQLSTVALLTRLSVVNDLNIFDKIYFLEKITEDAPIKMIYPATVTSMRFNVVLEGTDYRNIDMKLAFAELEYKVIYRPVPQLTESGIPPELPIDVMLLKDVSSKDVYATFAEAMDNAMQVLCPICGKFKNKPSNDDLTFKKIIDFMQLVGGAAEVGDMDAIGRGVGGDVEKILAINREAEIELGQSSRRFELDRNPPPINTASTDIFPTQNQNDYSFSDLHNYFQARSVYNNTYTAADVVAEANMISKISEIKYSAYNDLNNYATSNDTTNAMASRNPPIRTDELKRLLGMHTGMGVAGIPAVNRVVSDIANSQRKVNEWMFSKLSVLNINLLSLQPILGEAASHIVICADCQRAIVKKGADWIDIVKKAITPDFLLSDGMATRESVTNETFLDVEFTSRKSETVKRVNIFKKIKSSNQLKDMKEKLKSEIESI